MKPDQRTGVLDHPTLEDLECLIMCPEGTKGYTAEAILLQRLYGFCLVYGFARVFQMTEGIYDIWLDPQSIEKFRQTRQQHLDSIQKGLKIYDDSLAPYLPIEPKVDIRITDENSRIREENKNLREQLRNHNEKNQQQILNNEGQALDNRGQALDNQGQALDNQGQARDNFESRKHRRSKKPDQ